jgi:hypothetical protein
MEDQTMGHQFRIPLVDYQVAAVQVVWRHAHRDDVIPGAQHAASFDTEPERPVFPRCLAE